MIRWVPSSLGIGGGPQSGAPWRVRSYECFSMSSWLVGSISDGCFGELGVRVFGVWVWGLVFVANTMSTKWNATPIYNRMQTSLLREQIAANSNSLWLERLLKSIMKLETFWVTKDILVQTSLTLWVNVWWLRLIQCSTVLNDHYVHTLGTELPQNLRTVR